MNRRDFFGNILSGSDMTKKQHSIPFVDCEYIADQAFPFVPARRKEGTLDDFYEYIASLKSGDVAHGMTTLTETDTDE